MKYAKWGGAKPAFALPILFEEKAKKQMKKFSARLFRLSALFILIFSLTACSGPLQSQWVKAPGWSRARMLGTTLVNDASPVVLDDLGQIYLFFIEPDGESAHPKVTALDQQAEIVWERSLEVDLSLPNEPGLLWDGEALRLYWIDSGKLFTARLSATGEVISPAEQLSGEAEVETYSAVQAPSGEVLVWFAGSRRHPGLYALPADGQAPLLVDEAGTRPFIRFDSEGGLHASWAHIPTGYGDFAVLYAYGPDGEYRPGEGQVLFTEGLNPSSIIQGPWLAEAQGETYILWTKEIKTGSSGGTTITNYLHFPAGQPAEAGRPELVYMPVEYRLEYSQESGAGLKSGLRVPLTGDTGMESRLTEVWVNPRIEKEALIAFHSLVNYTWRQTKGQVSTAYFRDGQPVEYQLISFSSVNSTSPAVTSDREGYLYLTWLEKSEQPGYLVYFTSTAPGIRLAYDRLESEDVGRLAAETSFGLLMGAVLSPPAAAIWLIPALVVLALTTPLRRDREKTGLSPGSAISLGLAIIAFWFAKLASLPGARTYVPFSAWIPIIPAWLSGPLQILVPVLTGIVAVLVAWHYTYKRSSRASLYFLLIYGAVDTLLTMAVYGVLIYDAF